MYKLSFLIAKNLGRNKVRTGLTACAVIVLVMIYTMVSTVTSTISSAVEAHSSETRLLVRSKWAAIDGSRQLYSTKLTTEARLLRLWST